MMEDGGRSGRRKVKAGKEFHDALIRHGTEGEEGRKLLKR